MIDLSQVKFSELSARKRAIALLDEGSFEELLGEEALHSPILKQQSIETQADDGIVIARGKFGAEEALLISIDGNFRGGGIGKVSGIKVSGALYLAKKEVQAGKKLRVMIIFNSGGIRLQEANYGLLGIADIHSSIVSLREVTPVTAIVAGRIGAYGGMGIAAALCSSIIMTEGTHLSLNGPKVIETEATKAEFDASDREKIKETSGSKQRVETGLADYLVEDDLQALKKAVERSFKESHPIKSEKTAEFLHLLHAFDPSEKLSPADARRLFALNQEAVTINEANNKASSGPGFDWFKALSKSENKSPISTVRTAYSDFLGEDALFISVVKDESNPFYRVRQGEFGLREGWVIASEIEKVVKEDQEKLVKRPIIAIVDSPSQAYGYNEELLGIHQALAASVNAYVKARLNQHPIVAFIPGMAISGAFLAHGLQANRMIALNQKAVNVHVMSKEATARITKRSLDELDEVAKEIPAMAYDVASFERLGALTDLLDDIPAENPSQADVQIVKDAIVQAISDIRRRKDTDLLYRLNTPLAKEGRKLTKQIFENLKQIWS